MRDMILTVSQLNEYIKMSMDSDELLASVYLRGEISNFTNHYKTGHFYFSLKDENAAVRAVMFRSYAAGVAFCPENGMRVILHGRVSVFPRDGVYQIYVDDMQPDGVGAMSLALEQLRRKLEAEGLFDPAKKRPLPPYPEKVGIITSETGAAVRDILQILSRRFPAARPVLFPALVQGSGAPDSLIAGLSYFAREMPVDVIIIGRGGGSREDLAAFNDEALVRAIAASPVPVISAVGHESDVSLSDFAADLRAPTPSAAAELAVPDAAELKNRLNKEHSHLFSLLQERIARARERLSALSSSCVLRSPRVYLDERRMTLAILEKNLFAAAEKQTREARSDFAAICAKLDTLNPLRVLARGYAAVFDARRGSVQSVENLSAGDRLTVRFADGTADVDVVATYRSEIDVKGAK